MKRYRQIFSGILAAVTLALLSVSTSLAQTGGLRSGLDAAHGTGQPTDIFGDDAAFNTIVDTMLFIVGAVAVIMIVYAGFRYVISGGNASTVTAAKNTILYAIVGVIVALLSYAILDFVLVSIQGGGSGGNTSGL